jgi:hypothetical protein
VEGEDPGGIGALLVSTRPLAEYRAMFALSDDDLRAGPILDCPGGGSSFGAEARALGADVTSADPAYDRPGEWLVAHAREEALRGNRFVAEHAGRYVFTFFRDVAHHRELRLAGWERFAADFGPHRERYVAARLPDLPFPDARFALTLSSHLLFTYADRLDFGFHVAALAELARVTSGEVRVFPLVDLEPRRYPRLAELLDALAARGLGFEVRTVTYEFQRGGTEMLVWRRDQ